MIDSGEIDAEGSVVHAGVQHSGRGMGNTSWQSEPGKNLLFSVLLKPVFIEPAWQFLLNKCIALSLREALSFVCSEADFIIKWPNDIYSGGGKISGTLIENRIMGKTLEMSVIGVGININQEAFPSDIPRPVSLKLLSGREFSVNGCLKAIYSVLLQNYLLLKEDPQGRAAIIEESYTKNLMGYGKVMSFKMGGRELKAEVCGVDRYGKLLIRDNKGNTHACGTKEVEFSGL